MPRFFPLTAVVAAALAAIPVGAKQARSAADQTGVSATEIEQTLHAIDLDRTSGREGERTAAAYLDRKLTEYGVAHRTYEARLFMSWPGRAELILPGQPPIAGKTAAFAAPTPPGGLKAPVVVDPPMTRRTDRSLAFGPEVRGRIAVVHGIADTEALVLGAQRAAAAGVVQIDSTDTLHEDIVTTIWGTPAPDDVARLPAIPFLSITHTDGDRLKAAANGAAPVTLITEATRAWRRVPVLVADVPGRTAEFVLVTTHLDAWYRGMTDTAGSVASILDMARALQARRGTLERGVRFAWWPGHSFGRYAGSAWYVDRFHGDLDEHCVAYMNLDGPGRRGSQMDKVAASGWPGIAEYAQAFASRLPGVTPAASRESERLFRPGRDSDSSYQGLGIPFVSIGVPGPPRGHPDVDAEGRIRYWHTAEDTLDKIDVKALTLDTSERLALLSDLATVSALPHRLGPIAAAYRQAIEPVAAAGGSVFDLSSTIEAARAFADAAALFDGHPKPSSPDGVARFNELVVRLTHRLYSTLYTKGGRFTQDPAAEMPVLPLLARVKDLAALPREGDEFGFLETELVRGRNTVESTLRDATRELGAWLASQER